MLLRTLPSWGPHSSPQCPKVQSQGTPRLLVTHYSPVYPDYFSCFLGSLSESLLPPAAISCLPQNISTHVPGPGSAFRGHKMEQKVHAKQGSGSINRIYLYPAKSGKTKQRNPQRVFIPSGHFYITVDHFRGEGVHCSQGTWGSGLGLGPHVGARVPVPH